MNRCPYPLLIVVLPLFCMALSSNSSALECANVGAAWSTQPDDTGDAGATACGDGAVASGNDGIALGTQASASGNFSIALGQSASAADSVGIAIGASSVAGGDSGVAVGYLASSGGSFSSALGDSASSAGNDSIALGAFASSAGIRGTALGRSAAAGAQNSTALGQRASASGIASTALGAFASSPNDNTIVLGAITGVNAAPTSARVGIGTTDPQAALHVARNNGKANIFVEETNPAVGPRTLFTLANPGNTKFEIANTDAMNSWAFTNSGGDFRISLQNSGFIEFRVDNFGNAYVLGDLEVGGDLFTNVLVPSDRNAKRNIEAIDAETVLRKVAALPVSAWEYGDRPGERHIGPMAQDFRAAFGLGNSDRSISVVDATGVALASIQALAARNHELEREVSTLTAQNRDMNARLELLEAALTHLLPRSAQN